MKIANNLLKRNLKNVYFLGGTACGGKTTMGKAIAEKYGIVHFDDNYHHGHYDIFRNLWEAKYQPHSVRMRDIRAKSWEDYFARLANGEDILDKATLEHLEFILLELVKLSQNQKVVADLHLPTDLAKEISDYNKVAFLITSPENVVKGYYRRDDHSDIYDLIMSLDDPQTSLDNLHKAMYDGTKRDGEKIKESGCYYIMRDENSTVEKTLAQLEKHFALA